jgi:hypothetical protein
MKRFFTTLVRQSLNENTADPKLAKNLALMKERCLAEIELRKNVPGKKELKSVSTESFEQTLREAESLKKHSAY